MITHSEQRLLGYRPEQMYDLVADIERYPEFLPWCIGARDPRAQGEPASSPISSSASR